MIDSIKMEIRSLNRQIRIQEETLKVMREARSLNLQRLRSRCQHARVVESNRFSFSPETGPNSSNARVCVDCGKYETAAPEDHKVFKTLTAQPFRFVGEQAYLAYVDLLSEGLYDEILPDGNLKINI